MKCEDEENQIKIDASEDKEIMDFIEMILKDALKIITEERNYNELNTKENEIEEDMKLKKYEQYQVKNGKNKINQKDVAEKIKKVDHYIIKNNKNAIENIETVIMELQDVYIKRIEEMELKINTMETSFKK